MSISFLDYLGKRRHEPSPVGDLAQDMLGEVEMAGAFPSSYASCDPDSFITLIEHVPPIAWEAAAQAWIDYQSYKRKHEHEPQS